MDNHDLHVDLKTLMGLKHTKDTVVLGKTGQGMSFSYKLSLVQNWLKERTTLKTSR